MNTQPVEIETPVGRIVAGNPLEMRDVIDPQTGQAKVGADGQKRQECYFALAIQKQGEAQWWDTEWGRQILAVAQRDWPNGEWQQAGFAWKVTDGDSEIPNKRNKRPCDQEGYAGHWVLNCATGLPVRCYRDGQFEQHQVLQPAAREIKTGDYGRAWLNVRGNGSLQTAGIYLNPELFSLIQAGPAILSAGADPKEAFSPAPTMPTNVLPDPGTGMSPPAAPGVATPPPAAPGASVPPPTAPAATPPPAAPAGAPGATPTPPAPQVQPAPDFLNPDQQYQITDGSHWTAAQLKASGWTDDQIKALPKVG